MKPFFFILAIALIGSACNSNNQTPEAKASTPVAKESAPGKALSSKEAQMKLALLAAPEEKREGCTVWGYSEDTALVLLRQGSNELICVADDPRVDGFSAACYAKELAPFMQRGRELRQQGITDQALFDEREKEVKEGKLSMPKGPAALFVYSAKNEDVDGATGDVKNGYLRSVIYIPYATAASTGLPEQPAGEGMPWIMHAGTHGAHIMINPKK